MKTPLVSFIIPYFNSGSTIQETIDSIFNQTYPNYDIWLINDGSTDIQSIEKLKDFEGNDKIHILQQENAGPSVARNNAIKLSNAEFIIPLDADNLIVEDSVIKAVNCLVKDIDISAVYGNFHFFGEEQGLKKQDFYRKQKALIYNQIDTCAIIRKSI
jgi:glycosyltransferase involved in cell wall biosynthesis